MGEDPIEIQANDFVATGEIGTRTMFNMKNSCLKQAFTFNLNLALDIKLQQNSYEMKQLFE